MNVIIVKSATLIDRDGLDAFEALTSGEDTNN